MIALNHAVPLSRRPKLPLLGGLGLGGRIRHSAGLNGVVVGITASGAPSGLGAIKFLILRVDFNKAVLYTTSTNPHVLPPRSPLGERVVEGRGPDKFLFTRHERKWHGIGGWLMEDQGDH